MPAVSHALLITRHPYIDHKDVHIQTYPVMYNTNKARVYSLFACFIKLDLKVSEFWNITHHDKRHSVTQSQKCANPYTTLFCPHHTMM